MKRILGLAIFVFAFGAQAKTAPFAQTPSEMIFLIRDTSGQPPSLTVFDKTYTAQKIALGLNYVLRESESDPGRKARMPVEEKISNRLEAIRLQRPKGHPDKIDVFLVLRDSEIYLPQVFTLEQLRTAQHLSIDVPSALKAYGPYSVKGSAHLSFDPNWASSELTNVGLTVQVQIEPPLLGTVADSGKFENARGAITPKLAHKPMMFVDPSIKVEGHTGL